MSVGCSDSPSVFFMKTGPSHHTKCCQQTTQRRGDTILSYPLSHTDNCQFQKTKLLKCGRRFPTSLLKTAWLKNWVLASALCGCEARVDEKKDEEGPLLSPPPLSDCTSNGWGMLFSKICYNLFFLIAQVTPGGVFGGFHKAREQGEGQEK